MALLHCPNCELPLSSQGEYIGRKIRCPRCRCRFVAAANASNVTILEMGTVREEASSAVGSNGSRQATRGTQGINRTTNRRVRKNGRNASFLLPAIIIIVLAGIGWVLYNQSEQKSIASSDDTQVVARSAENDAENDGAENDGTDINADVDINADAPTAKSADAPTAPMSEIVQRARVEAKDRELATALRKSPDPVTPLEFPPLPKGPDKQPKWPKKFFDAHPVLQHLISDRSVRDGNKLVRQFTPAQLGAMAPKQVPGYYSNCPKCRMNVKGKSWSRMRGTFSKGWSWSPKEPDRVTCKHCKTSFPNASYPMTETRSYLNPKGETITLPCFVDKKKRVYHINSTVDSMRHKYLVRVLKDLSMAYHVEKNERAGKAVVEILKGYAANWPSWLTHMGTRFCSTGGPYMRNGKPVDPKRVKAPYGWSESRYSAWTTWWFWSYPRELLDAYDLVYKHPAWDREKAPDGSSLRFWVESRTFDDQTEWLLSYPWKNQIKNNICVQIGEILKGGMVMGRPAYAEFVRNWCQRMFYVYDSGHDMMTTEGPGYHSHWMGTVRSGFQMASKYRSPQSYVSGEPDGFDSWDMPAKRRQALSHLMLRYPDGTRYPIGDTPRNKCFYYPLRQSVNRIAPGFGTSVLGDGYGAIENQAHATLVWSGGNHSHCHEDGLGLLLFAKGVELFSDAGGMWDSHNTWFHNCASIDRKIHQKIKNGTPSGDLEMHIPHLPGIAVVRVDGRNSCYPNAKNYDRTLVHNTLDLDHPFVIDVFRVRGGTLHEYFLQGSMEAKTKDTKYDPNMVQTGSCSLPLSDYVDPQGAMPKAWKGFHDLKSTPMTKPGFVDFRFKGRPELGTRTHFAPSADTTLVLGKQHSFRGAKVAYGKNKIPQDILPGFTIPKLILQRQTKEGELESVFVLVHEVLDGKSVIRDFSYELTDNGVVAIQLTAGDRTDHMALSLNGSNTFTSGPLSGEGVFAYATVKGAKCDLWMARATRATCLNRTLTQDKAEYLGNVLRVTRQETGAIHDAYLTDAPIPVDRDWHNEVVMVDFFDAAGERTATLASEIIDVVPDGDRRWVVIKQDAGAVPNPDGSWRELFYPHRKELGKTCKLRIVTSATTVPQVRVTPDKGRYETAWVNDFMPLDAKGQVVLESTSANARIKVSDGLTDAGVGQLTVTCSDLDTRLTVEVDNPDGVVHAHPKHVRFIKAIPSVALDAGSLRPGVKWTHCRPSGDQRSDLSGAVGGKIKATGTLASITQSTPPMSRGDSLVFEGYLRIEKAGFYTFYSRAYGGARLRIDSVDVLESVNRQDDIEWTGTVFLEKGLHQISYANSTYGGGGPLFRLRWTTPGAEKKTFLPERLLFHTP